jgi:hypothetical protein
MGILRHRLLYLQANSPLCPLFSSLQGLCGIRAGYSVSTYAVFRLDIEVVSTELFQEKLRFWQWPSASELQE